MIISDIKENEEGSQTMSNYIFDANERDADALVYSMDQYDLYDSDTTVYYNDDDVKYVINNYYDGQSLDYAYRIRRFHRPYFYDPFYWDSWYYDPFYYDPRYYSSRYSPYWSYSMGWGSRWYSPTIAGDGEAIILHIITAHGIVLITLIMAGDIPIIHGMDMAISGILIQKITGTDKDVPPIQV